MQNFCMSDPFRLISKLGGRQWNFHCPQLDLGLSLSGHLVEYVTMFVYVVRSKLHGCCFIMTNQHI